MSKITPSDKVESIDRDDEDVEEFLIMRKLDEPVPVEAMEDTQKHAENAVVELQEEGKKIEWVESDLLVNDNQEVEGTFCTYLAEDEDLIIEHAEKTGLPKDLIAKNGGTVEGTI